MQTYYIAYYACPCVTFSYFDFEVHILIKFHNIWIETDTVHGPAVKTGIERQF